MTHRVSDIGRRRGFTIYRRRSTRVVRCAVHVRVTVFFARTTIRFDRTSVFNKSAVYGLSTVRRVFAVGYSFVLICRNECNYSRPRTDHRRAGCGNDDFSFFPTTVRWKIIVFSVNHGETASHVHTQRCCSKTRAVGRVSVWTRERKKMVLDSARSSIAV